MSGPSPPLSLHSATGWQRRRLSEAFLIMPSFLAECSLTPTLSQREREEHVSDYATPVLPVLSEVEESVVEGLIRPVSMGSILSKSLFPH